MPAGTSSGAISALWKRTSEYVPSGRRPITGEAKRRSWSFVPEPVRDRDLTQHAERLRIVVADPIGDPEPVDEHALAAGRVGREAVQELDAGRVLGGTGDRCAVGARRGCRRRCSGRAIASTWKSGPKFVARMCPTRSVSVRSATSVVGTSRTNAKPTAHTVSVNRSSALVARTRRRRTRTPGGSAASSAPQWRGRSGRLGSPACARNQSQSGTRCDGRRSSRSTASSALAVTDAAGRPDRGRTCRALARGSADARTRHRGSCRGARSGWNSAR